MLNLHAVNTNTSAERALVEAGSAGILDLEEALEPPNLEDALANDDSHLEDAPPLDAGVGALGGIAVRALADDDVALLVLDLGEEFGEELDCGYECQSRVTRADCWLVALTLLLKRVLRCLALRNVDDSVHIEADLLRVC